MTDTKLQIRIDEGKKALWQEKAEEMGLTLTDMVKKAVDSFVMTGESENVMTEEVVMTDVPTEDEKGEDEILEELSTEVTQDELIREIKAADKMGDGKNWERVKGMAREAGYEWDGRTKELSKDGRVVWKAY
jgi:hypothetical protein